jgi:membrane protein implicated in regulation of membrane protease activity
MSFSPKGKKFPSHWGVLVTLILTLGGMAFLFMGSILYSSPTPQPLTGVSLLLAGGICFVIFAVLLLLKRRFLFPPQKKALLQGTELYSPFYSLFIFLFCYDALFN